MEIDIHSMSTQELVQLNRRIVAVVAERRRLETHRDLAKFSVGDHVEFSDSDGSLMRGVVARVNRKTISIDTYQPHGHWRVSPGAVSKVESQVPVSALQELRLMPKDGEIFC